MEEPARQVQRIARCEDDVQRRLTRRRRGLHLAAPLRPGLRAKRRLEHRLVHDPALLTGELEHEHVVQVVVRGETT